MLCSKQRRYLCLLCLLLVAGCSSPVRTIAPQVTGATWTCYGNRQQWHCVPGRHLPPPPGAVDLAPAPTDTTSSPADTDAPEQAPPGAVDLAPTNTASSPADAATPSTAPPPTTVKAAQSAPNDQPIATGDTVIQLVAVRHRQELARYRHIYRQFQPQSFRHRVAATTWYVLLLGPFSDTAAAQSRLARLPTGADLPTPWVRRATHDDSPLPAVSANGL